MKHQTTLTHLFWVSIMFLSSTLCYAQAPNRLYFSKDGLECFIVPTGSQGQNLSYRFIHNSTRFMPGETEGMSIRSYLSMQVRPYIDSLKDSLRMAIPEVQEKEDEVIFYITLNREGEFRDFSIKVEGNQPPAWLTEDIAMRLYNFWASRTYPRAKPVYYNRMLPEESAVFGESLERLLNPIERDYSKSGRPKYVH